MFITVAASLQVIGWKDSSPNWPIMCRAGRKTIHSLTHSMWHFSRNALHSTTKNAHFTASHSCRLILCLYVKEQMRLVICRYKINAACWLLHFFQWGPYIHLTLKSFTQLISTLIKAIKETNSPAVAEEGYICWGRIYHLATVHYITDRQPYHDNSR